MSRRVGLILCGGILAGLLLLFVYGIASSIAPAAPRPPELGGQQVPATVYEIRFDRKYDLFCSFDREEPTIFRGCKILGFTGRGEESTGSRRGSGSGGFSSFSGSSSYEGFFDHWLAIKLADGRMAYIPLQAVKYMEEVAPDGNENHAG